MTVKHWTALRFVLTAFFLCSQCDLFQHIISLLESVCSSPQSYANVSVCTAVPVSFSAVPILYHYIKSRDRDSSLGSWLKRLSLVKSWSGGQSNLREAKTQNQPWCEWCFVTMLETFCDVDAISYYMLGPCVIKDHEELFLLLTNPVQHFGL